MKKLTKKRIVVRFMDPLWLFFIIFTISFLLVMACLWSWNKKEIHIQDNGGYYCKYCQEGLPMIEDDKLAYVFPNLYAPYFHERYLYKQKAARKLRDIPCPCSKDGMHKLKWYKNGPRKTNQPYYLK